MRRYGLIGLLTIWLLLSLSCGFAPNPEQIPTLVETNVCCQQTPKADSTSIASQHDEEVTRQATGTTKSPVKTGTPETTHSPTATIPTTPNRDGALLRQGARFGSLAPYALDEIAIGNYQVDLPTCGETYLSQLPEESGEIILSLTYNTPVLPEQIELFIGNQQEGIVRIELLNSVSGLGTLIDQSKEPIQRAQLTEGACRERLTFSVETNFEVDTILITFKNLDAAAQVSAVEMLGRLEHHVEVPVLWRVPIFDTPVDIAMASNGLVYVATGSTGLYAYDLEGNQLKQFSVPSHAQLKAVTTDSFGNLIVADAGFGWFIILSPEGEQLVVGGDDTYYQAAISPLDGNLYLLKANSIMVFTTDTAELVRQLPLDELHSYVGLAFDPQGRIYTICDHDWSPTLLTIDPTTGEELNATPLTRSTLGEIIARDLAADENGNIYVLFSINTGQIAVHMLDPHGNLIRRFGTLSGDAADWAEGSFLDPRAITVSPDGRFIMIADGFEIFSFLTAFLMEPN